MEHAVKCNVEHLCRNVIDSTLDRGSVFSHSRQINVIFFTVKVLTKRSSYWSGLFAFPLLSLRKIHRQERKGKTFVDLFLTFDWHTSSCNCTSSRQRRKFAQRLKDFVCIVNFSSDRFLHFSLKRCRWMCVYLLRNLFLNYLVWNLPGSPENWNCLFLSKVNRRTRKK